MATVREVRGTATLTGDLDRWRRRVDAWAGLPRDWVVAGAGEVTAGFEVSAKAFKLGLTNCVIIAMSPGAAAEQLFTDPHDAPNSMARITATCTA